jgi:hypothetical protein
MKITNERVRTLNATRPGSPGRAGSAGGIAFASVLGDTATSETQAPPTAPAVSPVDVLLTAQEMPNGSLSRRRVAKRGRDILDHLDRVRLALISGAIPRRDLERLVDLLAEQREQTIDPGLAAVIDEINLRAQVEIAKHMRDD